MQIVIAQNEDKLPHQTPDNSLSCELDGANCRRIVWMCLTILWGWHLKYLCWSQNKYAHQLINEIQIQKPKTDKTTWLYVMKNTHGIVLLLACNFTKSNTPSWVFFTFFKLYEWYQIAQGITYRLRFRYKHIYRSIYRNRLTINYDQPK